MSKQYYYFPPLYRKWGHKEGSGLAQGHTVGFTSTLAAWFCALKHYSQSPWRSLGLVRKTFPTRRQFVSNSQRNCAVCVLVAALDVFASLGFGFKKTGMNTIAQVLVDKDP